MAHTPCPYAQNGPCARFSAQVRERLCASCHIKRYSADERLPLAHWLKGGAILLEGIMVAGSYDAKATNGFLASGIAGPGDPISSGSLVYTGGAPGREALCVTDCAVALFGEGVFEELFETDVEFARTLFAGTLKLCGSGEGLAVETCARDSYSAVRYVVAFCALYGYTDLTHEKIALICNRSRPTVTEALHRLAVEEPGLFAPGRSAAQ